MRRNFADKVQEKIEREVFYEELPSKPQVDASLEKAGNTMANARRDEKKWIALAQSGDENAFVQLIRPYEHPLYLLAYRKLKHPQEAEDIVQETLLRAYSHLNRFNRRNQFSTWIYRIASNLCIDRMRKKKADFYLDAPLEQGKETCLYQYIPASDKTPEELFFEGERRREVRQAMHELPSHYQSVMFMRYMKEMPLAEIGEALSVPVTTVKTRVHRGRKALVRQLAPTH
ncbi:ECF family DNA-directed RNA polymerase sigma subunit SigW [Desmospora sp. 8437]|nr:ECF family DNA-directed RNA polymerase sigma subunit SigW [Desmospora sp. 8437]